MVCRLFRAIAWIDNNKLSSTTRGQTYIEWKQIQQNYFEKIHSELWFAKWQPFLFFRNKKCKRSVEQEVIMAA